MFNAFPIKGVGSSVSSSVGGAKYEFTIAECGGSHSKAVKVNPKDFQYEVKPGYTMLIRCRRIASDNMAVKQSKDISGCNNDDVSGNLNLWLTFTDESLADEPIVAQASVCDVIKNHPRFPGDDKDGEGRRAQHVFRAWCNAPADAEYVTDSQGHKVIRTRMQNSRLMAQFLCLTDEIRKHAYWDLNINGFINGECVKQKIPLQVMKELRKPPINRKRKRPEYYTFPDYLLTEAPSPASDGLNLPPPSTLLNAVKTETEATLTPLPPKKVALTVPPAHTPLDPDTKLQLALQDAMKACEEDEAVDLSSTSSNVDESAHKRRLQLSILRCLEHQRVQRRMMLYESAPMEAIQFRIRELQDLLN